MFQPVRIPQMQPDTECKVCGGRSLLHGVVDFTKTCNGQVSVQLSGIPIYYYQCDECEFLFTRAFDDWDMQAFSDHIYNQNYGVFDPDYLETRPTNFAQNFSAILDQYKSQINGLDYGGGNGRMAQLMRDHGYDYASWDPMGDSETTPPKKQFNFISSIEVAEHVPEPENFFSAIDTFLAPDGVCIFTTCTVEMSEHGRLTDWWYVSPLNGHISIFSKPAIGHLAKRHGMQVHHVQGLHVLYRQPSPLLAHILATLGVNFESETSQPV